MSGTTIPKTSEWQRAAIKNRGPAAKLLVFFPPTFFKESRAPPQESAGKTWQGLPCAGPNRTTHQAAGWESLRHSRFFKNPCITLHAPAQNRCGDDLPRWKDARIHKRMEGFSHETKTVAKHKLGDFLEGKGVLHSPVPLRRRHWNFGLFFFVQRALCPAGGVQGVRIPPPSADRRRCPQEDSAGQTAGETTPPPGGRRYGRYLSQEDTSAASTDTGTPRRTAPTRRRPLPLATSGR